MPRHLRRLRRDRLRARTSRFHKETGEELTRVVEKMSKSLKNVVNPDDIVAEYGADTLRLYEMYMGPLEAASPGTPATSSGCTAS